MTDARGNIDLVGHPIWNLEDAPSISFENFIFPAQDSELAWATAAMESIGDWRARLRSVYIQWAMAINGLFVTSERYASKEYRERESVFTVSSLRVREGVSSFETIVKWPWSEAAKNHEATVKKMAVFGLVDLYSNLEDCVFEFAVTFYRQHPDALIRGSDFQKLRRLRRAAEAGASTAEWEAALDRRLESWRRNALYKGLDKVLVAFFSDAGLKKPGPYETGPERWASILRLFAMVRNALIHGAQVVTPELATESRGSGMEFSVNEPLEVSVLHLQAFELFTTQLLTAFNLALVERVGVALPTIRARDEGR